MFDRVRLIWKLLGVFSKKPKKPPVVPGEGDVAMTLPVGFKKAMAVVAGVIVVGLGKKLGLDDQTCAMIAAMVSAYIIGQGIADQGKAKAIVEAKAAENAVAMSRGASAVKTEPIK